MEKYFQKFLVQEVQKVDAVAQVMMVQQVQLVQLVQPAQQADNAMFFFLLDKALLKLLVGGYPDVLQPSQYRVFPADKYNGHRQCPLSGLPSSE